MQFIPDVDSPYFNICKVEHTNVNKLFSICQYIPYAVGFSSDGWIKYHIPLNNLVKREGSKIYIVRQPQIPKQIDTVTFPPTYCINLERRPDRRKNTQDQADAIGLDVNFFKAIDGKKLEMTPEIKHMFRKNNFNYRATFVAVALSHIALWKKLLESGEEMMMIMEDDLKFCDNFDQKIQHSLNILSNVDEWHFIYFQTTILHNKRNAIKDSLWNDNFPKVIPFDTDYVGYGFGCYIITRTGAKMFLDYIEKNGLCRPVDHLPYLVPFFKRYSTLPHLAFTDYVGPHSTHRDTDIQLDYRTL